MRESADYADDRSVFKFRIVPRLRVKDDVSRNRRALAQAVAGAPVHDPNRGQEANHVRFDLPAYNRIHQQRCVLPDDPNALPWCRAPRRR